MIVKKEDRMREMTRDLEGELVDDPRAAQRERDDHEARRRLERRRDAVRRPVA